MENNNNNERHACILAWRILMFILFGAFFVFEILCIVYGGTKIRSCSSDLAVYLFGSGLLGIALLLVYGRQCVYIAADSLIGPVFPDDNKQKLVDLKKNLAFGSISSSSGTKGGYIIHQQYQPQDTPLQRADLAVTQNLSSRFQKFIWLIDTFQWLFYGAIDLYGAVMLSYAIHGGCDTYVYNLGIIQLTVHWVIIIGLIVYNIHDYLAFRKYEKGLTSLHEFIRQV
jgi:hypothetical protein